MFDKGGHLRTPKGLMLLLARSERRYDRYSRSSRVCISTESQARALLAVRMIAVRSGELVTGLGVMRGEGSGWREVGGRGGCEGAVLML